MSGTGQAPDERVILVPVRQARDRLSALLRHLQQGDPLTPVTVVGPSNYANLSLRHQLGHQGFASVRFIAFPRLAELLGAPSLAVQGLRPLTPTLESAAVQTVAERASGPLEGLRHHPTLPRSLRATFRDLRHAAPNAISHAAAVEPLYAEVARLFGQFRDLTANFYDREALSAAAARAVGGGHAALLRDLGIIFFYLPTGLTLGERSLASALSQHALCHTVLGTTGDPVADEDALELAKELAGDMPRVDAAASDRPGGDETSSTRIFIAPDPQEEVRWVLRQVLQRAEAGTPLRRMAVLYRQAQPYARLLREQCQLSEIPAAGPAVGSLADSAIGRTLSGLLRLASGDMDRDEVMGWLTACPVVPPDRSGDTFHPSQWDAISRAAGVVRGQAQWRERLERYAAEQERRAQDAEVQERRSEAALARMRREASETRALAAFVDALAADLRQPAEAPTWQSLTGWALRLLDRYVGRRSLPATEADASDRVTAALHALPAVAEMGSAASLEAFSDAVDELLSATAGHTGRTGEGLFIAPFATARGMEFDAVYLVGMTEGAVPPRLADDPLLPDRVRAAEADAHGAIPLRGGRAREERAAYMAALSSAPHRVLSYAKGDPAEQRRQFPSRWLLEQASALEGERVFSTTLERLGPREWLAQTASRQGALRAASDTTAVDLHDRDLQTLTVWREALHPMSGHYLVSGDAHLTRALAMEQGRRTAAFTAWDGDVSMVAGTSRRLHPTGRQVMSPTRLQAWARCPFQHFLSSVLGIAALETPEETDVITALDKGSLVHGILEEFLSEAIAKGPPKPDEPWSAADHARLRQIAQGAFADVEARGLAGRPLLWSLERDAILDDLAEFLRADSGMRKELGSTPWRVEMAFGFEADGPGFDEHEEGGLTLAFRGLIDRVDKTADGGALVLDYKTGGASFYSGLEDDPVDHGKLLQLPVYGLAAREVLGEDAVIRSAYWFVSGKGGFVRRPRAPLSLEAAMPRFREVVGTIASGIAAGYFPANPGASKGNCRFCDFDRVCPSRRDAVWERKRKDARLAGYVALADGDAAAEGEGAQ